MKMNKTMKNMFAVSASAILMFAGACTNTPEKEEVKAEPAETAAAAGAWTPAEDGTITDELMEIFDKAMDEMIGVSYTPVELLETQLVSGMNYRFLCDAVTVVPGAETRQAIITIYRDLNGNCSILDIQDYVIKHTKILRYESMAEAEQINTIDKDRVIRYIGHLDPADMEGVAEALRNHLGFDIPECVEAP